MSTTLRHSAVHRQAQPHQDHARPRRRCIDVTLQPIIFLVLFTYVFGGAIAGGSQHDYLQFLLPGHPRRRRSRWPACRSA